jgi:alkylation response protein AidB-like acyl-CoA dehydrogenase
MTTAAHEARAVETLAEVAAAAGARSAEIEQRRHIPPDLVDRLAATGVFKLWVPKIYGGRQAHVHDALDAIEDVAYHDGSTAWCVMIGVTTGLTSGLLPPEFANEIFGPPGAIAGGYGMPGGTGVAVDGGIRVTGRWSWGSGTDHCTWIGGGVRIVDGDGKPAQLADGTSVPFVFFDRDDVELLDTWHVAGLKGTASTDYTVTDGFVPQGRWVEFVGGPQPIVDSPLYRFSFLGALGIGVATVMVGLGRRAIDELVALADKVPAGSSRGLAERPPVQADIAAADAAVRSSRAFLREVVDECWDAAATDGRMTDEHKRLLRLAATNMAERCAHAVYLCYHAGGGTSVYETSPLQRVFRDTHVATQHGMIAPRTLEPLGRMVFGLPTDTRQL